jgi:hypothetical protein
MTLAVSQPNLVDRMVRAARLETSLYNEVESDTNATQQALLVVLIVAVATGIGSAIGGASAGAGYAIGGLIGGIIRSLCVWAIVSFVMYFVGTRLFKGTATYGEMLRTLGFASTPGILAAFSFIPFVGGLIALVAAVWAAVASFIAVREALDFDNGNTLATIIVGWLIGIAIMTILLTPLLIAFGLGAAVMRMY